MTQIEMDVARSAVRKNKAVAEYYESQNAIHNCIDWEQRRYEIARASNEATVTSDTRRSIKMEARAESMGIKFNFNAVAL